MPVQAIQDGDVIRRRTSVVSADTSDETILIDVDSGYFFQLNKSAAQIWQLVDPPRSFGDLCTAIQARFDASPETCRADVAEFVIDMRERGLLEVGA